MEKILEIEKGRSYVFKASAFSPIQYNKLFKGSDYLKDINAMAEKSSEVEKGTADFSMENYEQFVRLAYTFAFQGLSPSPRINDAQREFLEKYPDPWTWIDSFNSFSIYTLLPEIVSLWTGNEVTQVDAKNPDPTPPEK